jgi:putative membrane protein
LEGRNYILKVFPFESVNLLIFSGKNATDDMSIILNEKAEMYFGQSILVEAHNAYSKDFEVSKYFFELEELLKNASLTSTPACKLQYSFFKEKVETGNICGYLALLLLKYSESLHGVLMLDGNNIDKNFRDELERFCKEKGIEITVISTDNHSRTAISPKISYKPIGDKEDRKAVYEFLEKALKNLKFEEAVVGYSKSELTAKVMGREFFKEVEKAFMVLGEKSLYLLIAVILLQLISTIVLGAAIL